MSRMYTQFLPSSLLRAVLLNSVYIHLYSYIGITISSSLAEW